MKKLNKNLKIKVLSTLVVFLLVIVQAATFNIGWDNNPVSDGVTGYKLYSMTGTNRTLLSSVSTNITTITQPIGVYQFTVTATNLIGLESDLSLPLYVVVLATNVVAITNKPGSPLNIQIK